MYLAVSKWEALPGHEAEFEKVGEVMRATLAAQPGVELVKSFQAESGLVIVVHGYTDEETYNNITTNPNGPFVKAAVENGLESHARWISSDRGVTRE